MPSPLSDAVFWTSVVLCAVAQLGILRSVFAPREAPAPPAGVPSPRRLTEVLWAVVPAVGLAALLVLTWRAMHRRAEGAAAPISATTSALIAREAAPQLADAGGRR